MLELFIKNSKMKTIITIITLLSISIATYSQQQKFEKKLHNDFSSDINTVLSIKNVYGNITYHNWEKKDISVDITITLYTDNEANSQKYMENANVILKEDSGNISFKTTIKFENLDKSFKKGKSRFQVDYVINHPVYLKVNTVNSYGDISFNELNGNANITLNYGKLNAKNFAFNDSKPLSVLNLNYAKAEIEKCTWSQLYVAYSTLNIDNNTASEINSSYSHVWINKSYGIYATSIYDDYKIIKCKKMSLNSNYSTTIIDTLDIEADLNLNYGSLNIKNLNQNFENITINSNYNNVKANIPENACYILDASVNYGDIKYSPKANVEKRIKNSQVTVKGNIGCDQPHSKVKVKGNYCTINLF